MSGSTVVVNANGQLENHAVIGPLQHWCGHAQEVIPIPGEDGQCELVPVIGEAW